MMSTLLSVLHRIAALGATPDFHHGLLEDLKSATDKGKVA
jgi:hypothetical protein